jgi:hypothetical protein
VTVKVNFGFDLILCFFTSVDPLIFTVILSGCMVVV